MAKSNVKYPIVGDPKNDKGVYEHAGEAVPRNATEKAYKVKVGQKPMNSEFAKVGANQMLNAVKKLKK
jgi:hypothetical protein